MQPTDTDMKNTQAAGPGAGEDSFEDVKPLLDGASEYEYVEILNPLPVDFIAKFAVTRAVRGEIRIVTNTQTPTVTNDESDIRRNYGLDLRNKDHQGKANIVNRVTIPAGHTIRVLGNEAQVIVRQLVNEIMQRQKLNLMLADPHQRNIIEQQIIKRRDSVESILGRSPTSISDQLQSAVLDSQPQEVEFPDVTIKGNDETTEFSGSGQGTVNRSGSGTEPDNSGKRSVGRPPKAHAAA